jgi:cellulose synthase/poly-beta-1,6-N-acetylglucosamine synthase-like glycosyltransferase
VTRALFAFAAGLIGYTYVGFPAIVLARARLRPRPHHTADITPTVSVIVAARNEASSIGAKVDNLLALDYPPERLEVVIASDGSDDGTEAIAAARGDGRVRVLALPRVGKAGALNAAVAAATGEILVFSDANSMYAPDAVRALVAPFADREVGGVAGDQRYLPDGASAPVAAGERRYWDLDRAIKQAESRGGNAISATGAIYAVRRELFAQVPPGVTDDFATSTAVIARGRRLVFAPDAVAFEPVAASGEAEFERKVRVMTRGLNAVVARHELLDPRRHGFYALQLLSHKVLRRLMALPLAVLAVTAATGARRSALMRTAAAAQGALYGLGAAGLLLGRAGRRAPRVVALPAYFCLVNLASVRAVWNVARRRAIDRWEPQRGST